MTGRKKLLFAAAACLAAFSLSAAEKPMEKTAGSVISESAVGEKVKGKWKPLKVCVLDFTSVDIEGQKRFLNTENRPIEIPPQCTLNEADRKSVNSIMQGFVRMIDAWDNTRTNTANRAVQLDDDAFTREKALSLYQGTVHGVSRPMVIGAEYLSACLGRRGDVFGCLDPSLMAAAMTKLQAEPDFPKDFMLRLARETGATHLVCGTVSDLRTKKNSFKGYGIKTETVNYQLDVIIKMVDLAAQHTVYSNVYTGSIREQRPVGTAQFDSSIFQSLMTSALEQAAEDLYDVCKPGRKNKVSATPMPYSVTVNPEGGMFFKAAEAEIRIDGKFIGNGPANVLLPEGNHTVEVKASGYKTKTLDLDVKSDLTVNVKLEK